MDDKAKHVEAEGDAGPTTTVVGSHGCELTIRDSTSRDRRVVSLSSSSSLPLPLLSSPSPLPSSAPVASAPSSIFAAPMPVPMPMPMHVPATSSATVSGAGGGGAELLPFPQFVSLPPFVVRGVGPTGNVASHNDSNEARQPWRDDTPKTKNNKDDDDDDHNNNEDYDDDDDVVDVEEGVGGNGEDSARNSSLSSSSSLSPLSRWSRNSPSQKSQRGSSSRAVGKQNQSKRRGGAAGGGGSRGGSRCLNVLRYSALYACTAVPSALFGCFIGWAFGARIAAHPWVSRGVRVVLLTLVAGAWFRAHTPRAKHFKVTVSVTSFSLGMLPWLSILKW